MFWRVVSMVQRLMSGTRLVGGGGGGGGDTSATGCASTGCACVCVVIAAPGGWIFVQMDATICDRAGLSFAVAGQGPVGDCGIATGQPAPCNGE